MRHHLSICWWCYQAALCECPSRPQQCICQSEVGHILSEILSEIITCLNFNETKPKLPLEIPDIKLQYLFRMPHQINIVVSVIYLCPNKTGFIYKVYVHLRKKTDPFAMTSWIYLMGVNHMLNTYNIMARHRCTYLLVLIIDCLMDWRSYNNNKTETITLNVMYMEVAISKERVMFMQPFTHC